MQLTNCLVASHFFALVGGWLSVGYSGALIHLYWGVDLGVSIS